MRDPQESLADVVVPDGDLFDELLAELLSDAQDARRAADRATRRAVANEELISILRDGLRHGEIVALHHLDDVT